MTAIATPVMIVRDERIHLPGALESFAAFGDVLAAPCIYDTGSVDETRDIAEEAGARVEVGYWDDDFARARNAACAMATTPWVLIVDADERLAGEPQLLRAALHGAAALDVAAARQADDVNRLVGALVNRGRSRALGDDLEGAGADWGEAWALPGTDAFQLFAAEYLLSTWIEQGRFDAAPSLLRALNERGSDAQWLAWKAGELFALCGRHRQELASLRLVHTPRTALDQRVSVAPAMRRADEVSRDGRAGSQPPAIADLQ